MTTKAPQQRPECWPLLRSGNARQASANACIGDAQPARDENVGWPSWYDGKSINEALFCQQFLATHQIAFTVKKAFSVKAIWCVARNC